MSRVIQRQFRGALSDLLMIDSRLGYYQITQG